MNIAQLIEALKELPGDVVPVMENYGVVMKITVTTIVDENGKKVEVVFT